MFIDKVKIYVEAGEGGRGCISFRREKYIPKGGPDGGNGGKGGDIIIVGNASMTTLIDFKYKPYYKSIHGEHGLGSNMYGKNAKDVIIKVPLGTVVRDFETEELLGDILKDGQKLLVAKGGKGGRGNASYKTSTYQTPRIAENGERGESRELLMELKTIADVGVIGYPNAGKSTLLSKVSNANPKIANYPFTTLSPNLGVVKIDEYTSFVWADLPGLIEGASEGVGLGDEFLRHIERTKILVHMIDVSAYGRDPKKDYESIVKELGAYSKELLKKPQVIVANKMDMPGAEEKLKKLKKYLTSKRKGKVYSISAMKGEGLKELIFAVYDKVKKLRDKEI
ncbi:MAG: GTPase ObgE [Candidatus Firestonebacteria bacterium]|nr:GTPase ObgE [Candidatus Firestonebacteria bacterium]